MGCWQRRESLWCSICVAVGTTQPQAGTCTCTCTLDLADDERMDGNREVGHLPGGSSRLSRNSPAVDPVTWLFARSRERPATKELDSDFENMQVVERMRSARELAAVV